MFPIRFNSPEKWLRGLPVGRTVSNENWVSIPPRSGSGDYTGVGCIIVHGRFQFPREVAQGTTAGGSSEFRTASFNSPEKWLRGIRPLAIPCASVGSFNSPEKWLRGILHGCPVGNPLGVSIPPRSGSGEYAQVWQMLEAVAVSIPPRSGSGEYEEAREIITGFRVSIPPRSGSGDYMGWKVQELTERFQFPREVAQGTTYKGRTDDKSPWFQFPREVAQGTTAGSILSTPGPSFNSPEK